MDLGLAIAVLVVAAVLASARYGRKAMTLALLLATAVAIPLAFAQSTRPAPPPWRVAGKHRPHDSSHAGDEGYVSSRTCRSCHPGAYDSWKNSHHAKMTQVPSADTVLPPWKHGTELQHQGRRYRLLRRNGGYWVDMPSYGTAGKLPHERMLAPVVMLTGSHNQQLFWIPAPWADKKSQARARTSYQRFCGKCHGAQGEGAAASSLRQRELYRHEIFAVITGEQHKKALPHKPDAEASRDIVAYLERLQLIDRLQQFPFSWLVRDQRWVHEDDTFLDEPSEPDEMERYDEGWSNSCDQCHSLAARYALPKPGELGRARIAELGIACESCHGPGQAHVAYHRSPLARYRAHLDDDVKGNIVMPTKLDKQRDSAVCGQCHSDNIPKGDPMAPSGYRPGMRLEDHMIVLQWHDPPYPKWLQERMEDDPAILTSAFWNDGTMRIAGRDYNALLETACHTKGELRCSTCHQMHGADRNDQLKPGAREGKQCLDCHQNVASNITAHTRHRADSSGSNCLNCHMAHTTYGLLKAVRSHRVDSPNALLSIEKGRPTACNLCHLDKTIGEVADKLSAWYGQAELPAEGRSTVPAAVEWLLKGDGVQRAIAAWHFGWPPAQQVSKTWWLAPFVARVLDDQYAAVRYIAGHSLQTLPGFEQLSYDYVAAGDVLAKARRDTLAQWLRTTPRKSMPHAWIHDGRIDMKRVSTLAAQRDDTPVHISE